MPAIEAGEEILVGGQAVMEGVMMRAPHSYCVAVRKANGELTTQEQAIPRMSEKYPLFKYPVLRGLGTLGQAMQLGYRSLEFSANAALDEAPKEGEKPAPQISSKMMAITMVLNLALFIAIYKFVPLFLATTLGRAVPS